MPPGRSRQLVDTGVELALGQSLQELLASVETRTVTDALGVTTGSFFHHFRNRAHFAEAVARRFEELWVERTDRLLQETETVLAEASAEQIRDAAEEEWAHLERADASAGLQHLLWVARNAPLGEGCQRTGADVLRDAYHAFVADVQPVYERSVATMGREMLPPFTGLDMTVMINALAEGLQMVAVVAPEIVRPDLYIDAVAAAFIVITRPRTERADVGYQRELASLEAELVVNRPADRPRDRVETWRHIADAAAHLFVDRSPSDVRVAEVAEVAGVSTSTVYHQFGTVSAVAAAAWVQHLPELRAIAEEPLTAEEGPIQRIEQVLTRYAELARANRGMTEALVSEEVSEASASGRARPRSIPELVPISSIVLAHVRELRARGQLRRRIDGERLARSLLHLCTMQVLLFPHESVERIVDETMGMVFDGSLVAPT